MSSEHETPVSPRVAVDVLLRDQQAALSHGDADRTPPLEPLEGGFSDARALLNWWQAMSVRTFGHLRDRMPAVQLLRDGVLRAALLDDLEDRHEAARERQRVREHCHEACTIAYRHLETRANEWLADSNDADTDWTQIDPERQKHPAMRPAFGRLDREQARALDMLWGGFGDRAAVMEWVHALPPITVFERDITDWLVTDRYALTMLETDSQEAAGWREQFATTMLLPAMAKRATRLRAGERVEATRQERTVPHG